MPFSTELKQWRTRRRVSQLELAVRAGTTQRHLSFLESGRSQPRREIVVRLAESLELPLRERNSLLMAAGYAPAFPESTWDDPALGPTREALTEVIAGFMPYPAVVVRPYGEVVVANEAISLFTEDAPDWLLKPPLNILRLAVHPDGMGKRILNCPEWGRHIVDSLRATARRNPDDRLEAFVAELQTYLPELPPDADPLGFAVPLRLNTSAGELRLITTLTSFATAVDITLSELHLEAFLPADAETAHRLRTRHPA